MKKVNKDIFLKLMFNIQKNYLNFIVTYHFYLKEINFKKLKSLLLIYMIKIDIHIRILKQALNHGLILRKGHRVIRFNQDEWLKYYIEMNVNDFFKLMNYAVFGKTMENVRKHSDIKLVTKERRRNYLVSEPNYHTTKFFRENLLAIEMKKTQINMNKPVYLGLSILNLSKTGMFEFWYDYVKPKYGEKAKLCCMDTGNFIVKILHYKDIAADVETRFDTFKYKIDRQLSKGKK